ncbi:MAG: glycogen/starch synthase [bacterium]
MSVRLAFVAYETPFAPCGGIAAVIDRLPGYVLLASGLTTLVITPFHHRIGKTRSLEVENLGSFSVPFDGKQVRTELLRRAGRVPCYFLRPEDPRFFAGIRHPYDVDRTPGEAAARLLEDSLFFGAAVARALDRIEPETSWRLLLQDWEAATVALSLAPGDGRHRMYLTLHNSYDSPASPADLLRAGVDPVACPGHTILDRALARVERPVFTVSEQFALDLTEDVLQARIMAPHLRGELRPRLIGVNNGPFAELAVGEELLTAAAGGRFEPLREWKAARRQQALASLEGLAPDADRPVWGDLKRFRREEPLWFVLAGRDDARQKGYDVAVESIRSYLRDGGEGCFLFFPIPGDEGLSGLEFLKELAGEFAESVLAFPFLLRETYFAVLQGASYGLMPSFYEPFGMANEFYLNGTVGIGRATGGILMQIVPLQAASSYSRAVEVRAARWHCGSAHPTGILYREPDGLPSALGDWRALNADQHGPGGGAPDRLGQRRTLPLFRAMADELRFALMDAALLYRERPHLYYGMLTQGIAHIRQCFSWERAAREYLRAVL